MPISTDEYGQAQGTVLNEKMAMLGRMVAGIVHEINTPASAINAASVNAIHHVRELLSVLMTSQMFSLDEEIWFRILDLIQKMTKTLDTPSRRSSSEMRDEQKRVNSILEQRGIYEGAELARQLTRMDLGEAVDEVLALTQVCPPEDVLLVLTHCHRIMTSLSDIHISADMLLHDVRAVKSYAHPGQEHAEVCDVHATLDVALTVLKNQLKHRIQVDCLYGNLPLISGHASELSHIWINLLQNAVQAIDGEGRIEIKTFTLEGAVGITITDNGPGIPADVQSKIFDRHFTTKAPGDGTGLGLALVKQIIAHHRGTITVKSQPGHTVFEIRLPNDNNQSHSRLRPRPR